VDGAGVEFATADLQQASKTMIQIYVAMSESELDAISQHTNATLAAAKPRGVKLARNRPRNLRAIPAPRVRPRATRNTCDSRSSPACSPNSKMSQHHPLDFLKSHNRR
jgi:DNA invertase Pin-like site-specific DNA recombinase